jgi:hypothetical protein
MNMSSSGCWWCKICLARMKISCCLQFCVQFLFRRNMSCLVYARCLWIFNSNDDLFCVICTGEDVGLGERGVISQILNTNKY